MTLKPQDPTYEHPSHATAMGPQQGGPPQCVKCGAQSEGLSAPCKLTPYGVHDLGPLPQRNLGTGCVEGCRYPTLHVPGCKHDEYDRLTVARERARLHLFRAEYELESFSGYKLVAVGGQLHRMSPTQLPSVDELKSQILAAIEKRPVSPSLCVVRGCTNESYDPASVQGLCWKHEHPESLKSGSKRLLAAGVTPKIPDAVMRDMPVWSDEIKRKHLSVIRPLSVSEGHIPEAARCDPGDLCSLHKPCAKHGGMSARAIVEDSGRVCCGIVSVNNSIQTECAETALGYIRSGDAVCLKHAKDFQIDRLVEPFPPEYLGLSIERDRLSLQAQRQFQILASATSSTSLRKTQLSEMKLNIGFDKPSAAQTQLTHSDERGTDST